MCTCHWLQKVYKIPRWAYSSVVRTEFFLWETKLIDATEISSSVQTLAELVTVTKRCDLVLTVFAGQHPSYLWILDEYPYVWICIVWSVVSDQLFVLNHSCEGAELVLVSPLYGPSELLPSWLCEIVFLCAFLSFLCFGKKHKSMVLEGMPLQATLVPQWLMWYNKKDKCFSIYMCLLGWQVLVKDLSLPKIRFCCILEQNEWKSGALYLKRCL